MIWPRRKNDSEFTDLPIAIAPGGGGASAVWVLKSELSNYQLNYPINGTSEEIYRFHVNVHFDQYLLIWPVGGRGIRPSDSLIITSGSGGGLISFSVLEVDGKLLRQENSFAEGGFDCSSSESRVFTDV